MLGLVLTCRLLSALLLLTTLGLLECGGDLDVDHLALLTLVLAARTVSAHQVRALIDRHSCRALLLRLVTALVWSRMLG